MTEATNNKNRKGSFYRIDIHQLTKMAICISLMCVSSFIAFPIPFSPIMITAQTIIVNLIALLLNPKQSAFALLVYILLGICGLPVFSGGIGGIGKLLGPSGGYIWGFLLAAPLISLIHQKKKSFGWSLFATIGVGIPIIYILGTLQMAIVMQMNLPAAFMAAVVPYIAGDLLKCVAACLLSKALELALKKTKLF